jgi:hypothetical protein
VCVIVHRYCRFFFRERNDVFFDHTFHSDVKGTTLSTQLSPSTDIDWPTRNLDSGLGVCGCCEVERD